MLGMKCFSTGSLGDNSSETLQAVSMIKVCHPPFKKGPNFRLNKQRFMQHLCNNPHSAKARVESLLRLCCGSYTCSIIRPTCHFRKFAAASCKLSWSVQTVKMAGQFSEAMISSVATNCLKGLPNISRQCFMSKIQCKVGSRGWAGLDLRPKRLRFSGGCSPGGGGSINLAVCCAKASWPSCVPVTGLIWPVTCPGQASMKVIRSLALFILATHT